ncbi:MAG: hypothetical protein ACYTBJ_00405 [Planctomycetota bacterium]|jgi:hypothetical protein
MAEIKANPGRVAWSCFVILAAVAVFVSIIGIIDKASLFPIKEHRCSGDNLQILVEHGDGSMQWHESSAPCWKE